MSPSIKVLVANFFMAFVRTVDSTLFVVKYGFVLMGLESE